MNKEKNIEYLGYGVLINLLHKIHLTIIKSGIPFLKWADRLRFEQYKMQFGERDDDIYIATYPKSGTSMMQMILYHLTTEGDMDFSHIYDVSPWIRNASFKKQEPVELPSPRLIKTHDFYSDFPVRVKGRFIYVYRNGMDVAVSLYHQHKNYNKDDLKFDKFIRDFLKRKAWFRHARAWFNNKRKFPVLYIRYEDLLNDKRTEIDRIIDFCKLHPSSEAIERALNFSSFEYMKKHEKKFGDQPPERKKVYDQFIRKGKAGEGEKEFSEVQKEEFMKHYHKVVKSSEEKAFGKSGYRE